MLQNKVNFGLVDGMLTTKQTKSILQLGKVTALNNAVLNAEKQRFLNSCELGRLLFKTSEHFNDLFKAYKSKAKDEKLPKDEIADKGLFIEHVYGFQKSWYYKLVKVGEIEADKVNEYVENCENTKGAKITIENLLIWAKAKDNPEIEDSEIGVDSESIADLKAVTNEDRAKKVYLVNLSINGEFLESKQGIALKVGENLSLETANNLNDILKALEEVSEVVRAQLNKAKGVPQRTAKKVAENNAKILALKDLEEEFEEII
jgi:hypothetical protein